ncbi:uncharacterized protein LOC135580089 [Columba livia]|uniref:uncharacterized protein LOC135580089 n=1 Tax=Columba livia TaxID=8932 RepID=UPI0031BB8F48
MSLSPILLLTMALQMYPLFPSALGLPIFPSSLTSRTEIRIKDQTQPPVVAESPFSEWPGSTGLRSPCEWVRLRTGVVPEGLKQPPVVAENPFSEWASSIGLGSLQDWIRVRTGGIPAEQSQPPVVAESEDCELLFPLDQLWDSLAWVDMFWLICNASPVVCLLCMAWITVRLWRNGERPQGQGRTRTASSSTGTDDWKLCTCRKYKLLCRLEAKVARMIRALRRVQRRLQQQIRLQRAKKVAKAKARRGEPTLSPVQLQPEPAPVDLQKERSV